ncbi:MAG: hypothetical protein IT578_11785 [Verrucomicrobiae bacterium]|nr:hypothetical protein [Verrucomicrobiae bacterium]
MKPRTLIGLLGLAVVVGTAGFMMFDRAPPPAVEKPKGPPHGGLLIELDAAHLEFLLEPDSKVRIYTYDPSGKPLVPSTESLLLTIRGKDIRAVAIPLQKDGDGFVSEEPVQVPEEAKAVLTYRQGSEVEHFRFDLTLTLCPGCQQPEYRCACSE